MFSDDAWGIKFGGGGDCQYHNMATNMLMSLYIDRRNTAKKFDLRSQ